jgi:ABC-type lipoprotein export system ATPase subunit
VLILRLGFRALAWRVGVSATVFAVALVGVVAAAVGPICLRAVDATVLTERLTEAPQKQRDIHITQDTREGATGVDWHTRVRSLGELAADETWFDPPVFAEQAQLVYRGATQYATHLVAAARAARHGDRGSGGRARAHLHAARVVRRSAGSPRSHPRGTAVTGGVEVRCQGVVHIYPAFGKDMDDVVALRGVDLEVPRGEFVALLGPSGSGKSTVLGLLAGVLRPSAGRVLVEEHDVGRMPPAQLGKLRGSVVATVLQNPARNVLPYATVRQNVQFAAPRGGPRGRADELLDRLGLARLSAKVAGRLSGGEQQRVAIAAAACSGARLLLADEPTSQLDAAGRDEVMALVRQVNHELGATVVLVTHDPHVAAESPRTVTIRDGRVGAEGRRGREYAVVGKDGALHLPPDVLEKYPPGTLLEVAADEHGIGLSRRAEPAT